MNQEPQLQDITLKCVEHNGEFVFTAKEQKFFKEKGFPKPKRCLDCRRKRRATQNGGNNDGR
jgi:hypothetical protein